MPSRVFSVSREAVSLLIAAVVWLLLTVLLDLQVPPVVMEKMENMDFLVPLESEESLDLLCYKNSTQDLVFNALPVLLVLLDLLVFLEFPVPKDQMVKEAQKDPLDHQVPPEKLVMKEKAAQMEFPVCLVFLVVTDSKELLDLLDFPDLVVPLETKDLLENLDKQSTVNRDLLENLENLDYPVSSALKEKMEKTVDLVSLVQMQLTVLVLLEALLLNLSTNAKITANKNK